MGVCDKREVGGYSLKSGLSPAGVVVTNSV